MRFLGFFKNRIAGFGQGLQLQRALNGHGIAAVYAGNVVNQGIYHQLVHHKAVDKQEDNQQRQPELLLAVHITKHTGSVSLAVLHTGQQAVQAVGNLLGDAVFRGLIRFVGDKAAGKLQLFFG